MGSSMAAACGVNGVGGGSGAWRVGGLLLRAADASTGAAVGPAERAGQPRPLRWTGVRAQGAVGTRNSGIIQLG